MARTIKVRTAGADGSWDSREVDLEEAKRILEAVYADDAGGLVADGKTMEVIWHIGPNVEEIVIIPEMLGAGG